MDPSDDIGLRLADPVCEDDAPPVPSLFALARAVLVRHGPRRRHITSPCKRVPSLPNELLVLVFSYLFYLQLVRCRQVGGQEIPPHVFTVTDYGTLERCAKGFWR